MSTIACEDIYDDLEAWQSPREENRKPLFDMSYPYRMET
jgi:hypothetical protein